MTIAHIITPKEKDLGGFSVRRLLPALEQRMVGPWIFFDHMGPADFPAGQGIDVRPHPHINLATVTYLFEGEILHRDSLGSVQPIRPGDINLMVAGKGIVHSERERPEVRQSPHKLHGLQLWHALPDAWEETDPAFYHYPAENMPIFKENGTDVRVMIGAAYGHTSTVKTFANTLYAEARLRAGARLILPEAEERAVYVVSGTIRIGSQHIDTHHLAILKESEQTAIEATTDAQIALIGGEKMPKRFIEWNFVSSRQERIAQAKQDWWNGRFPAVPGDEEEFIPLPDR